MSKQFIIILAVIILGLGALFVLTRDDNGSGGSNNGDTQANASNHTVGEGTSGVTLVEYADFQCSACGQYYPIVKQIKEHYGDEITVQVRHFPLVQVHPHAMIASRAAEAAARQDSFWEMHDLLFERQTQWSNVEEVRPVFEGYAQELGLNMEQFSEDMASSDVLDTINADIKTGQEINAVSTPTFLLNGEKIEEAPRSPDEFYRLIDEEIERQQAANTSDE